MNDIIPPDWKRILAGSSKQQLRDYASDSAGWSTCAIGEARTLYPDVSLTGASNGGPADRQLNRLGVLFNRAVKKGHRQKAIGVYKAIHARILTLILGGAK